MSESIQMFITKVKELPEFAHIETLNDFMITFNEKYQVKCGKCKKSKWICEYSFKTNGDRFRLCDRCREIMRVLMASKK